MRTNSEYARISFEYCDYIYSVYVTERYEELIKEYLKHHLYISEFVNANQKKQDKKDFKYIFYYNIDDVAFNSLHSRLESKILNVISPFKGENCKLAIDDKNEYYISDNDNYIVYTDKNNVTINVKETEEFDYQLLRIIREFIYRVEQDNGKTFMHGAACECNGEGLVIIGNKASGKTSLLTYFLSCGAGYLANDRLFLSKNENEIVVQGFPIPMRISYESINKFGEKIKPEYFYRNQRFSIDKALVTPLELSWIFNIKVYDYLKLRAIIIPNIKINGEGVLVEKINIGDVIETLSDNCYSPFDESRKNEWIVKCEKSKDEIAIEAMDMIQRICRYPIYKVTYGTVNSPDEIINTIYKAIA